MIFYAWNPAVGGDCAGLQADVYVCVGGVSTATPTATTATATSTTTTSATRMGVATTPSPVPDGHCKQL